MSIGSLFFSPSGRISPKQFWTGYAVVFVVTKGPALAAAVLNPKGATQMDAQNMGGMALLGVVVLLAGLVFLYPMIALAIKRLHDQGRSGWWQLIYYALYACMFGYTMVKTMSLSMSAAMSNQGDPQAARQAITEGLSTLMQSDPILKYSSFIMIGMFLVYGVLLGIVKGTPGENKYGPAPGSPVVYTSVV